MKWKDRPMLWQGEQPNQAWWYLENPPGTPCCCRAGVASPGTALNCRSLHIHRMALALGTLHEHRHPAVARDVPWLARRALSLLALGAQKAAEVVGSLSWSKISKT